MTSEFQQVKVRDLPKRCVLAGIRLYQLTLSPYLGRRCRFHPTCSSYAIEAIEVHGALKGSWMGLKRVLRCHPFHPGGYDPVPPKRGTQDKKQAPHKATLASTISGTHIYETKTSATDVSTEAP